MLAHCWVLGQQDRPPSPVGAGPLFREGCRGCWWVVVPGLWSGSGRAEIPGAPIMIPCGAWWVWGVGAWCGLLFGNCIVDASILFLLPPSSRPLVWCGGAENVVIFDARTGWSVSPFGVVGAGMGVGFLLMEGLAVVWLSFLGRMVDALATGADEGRGNLR